MKKHFVEDDGEEVRYFRRCHGTYQLHRKGGPAYEHKVSGAKAWYHKGELHRTDGPAFIYSNGDIEYWLHGKFVSKAEVLLTNYVKVQRLK